MPFNVAASLPAVHFGTVSGARFTDPTPVRLEEATNL
jgi:hypothetical protein